MIVTAAGLFIFYDDKSRYAPKGTFYVNGKCPLCAKKAGIDVEKWVKGCEGHEGTLKGKNFEVFACNEEGNVRR